jgi:NAD(P)H-flavin reductase
MLADLVDVHDLSPSVRSMRLRARGIFQWRPGQYVMLSEPSKSDVPLPISIASAPDSAHPGELEIAVSHDNFLDGFRVGDAVVLAGPFGRFVRRPGATHPVLFVAAGRGLAPVRALLAQELAGEGATPIRLLFGARAEADLLWRSELETLARRVPRFVFEPTLSQPTAGWSGRRGRLQTHLAEVVAELPEPEAYVCGPDEMVSDCVRRLEALGVHPERIITER